MVIVFKYINFVGKEDVVYLVVVGDEMKNILFIRNFL